MKKKVWRNGEIAHVRQLTTLYVKYGEDNVMEWGSISNSGTQSLVFSDDVTAEKSIRINNDAYGAIVSAQIQSNVAKLIRRGFAVQMTIVLWIMTQSILQKQYEFLKEKKWVILQ